MRHMTARGFISATMMRAIRGCAWGRIQSDKLPLIHFAFKGKGPPGGTCPGEGACVLEIPRTLWQSASRSSGGWMHIVDDLMPWPTLC